MSTVRHPSDQDIDQRDSLQGYSSPVQVRESYIGNLTVTCRLILQKHRSVQFILDIKLIV